MKVFLRPANFTLGPDATLNTEINKNSVRIKAPKIVNVSKRKHKNQINHYDKQAVAFPRHQEEERPDKTKQAQIDQTYEKH